MTRHHAVTEAEFIAAALEDIVKKRRQHHVWQRYLKAWASDGQIHCTMDGRIFPTGTTAVAVQHDFYKIGKLTPADVALIRFDSGHESCSKTPRESSRISVARRKSSTTVTWDWTRKRRTYSVI
jgi:hypothetical protein